MRGILFRTMILVALVIGGCGSQGAADGWGDGGDWTATDPFRPVTLRVHPLTHIDPARAGDKGLIILHFELKDRFGDAVKALGTLRIELDKPGGGATPGMETQELTWDIAELAEPQGNADRFDPATRTYRVVLAAPRWVTEWASLPPAQRKDAPAWLRLRAVMKLAGEGQTMLEDDYVIQG